MAKYIVMDRNVVLLLYKHKMKIARNLGYRYGSKNSQYVSDNYMNVSVRKIESLHQKNKLGKYIGNNVKNQYNKNVMNCDEIEINELITSGFSMLNVLNELYNTVKK